MKNITEIKKDIEFTIQNINTTNVELKSSGEEPFSSSEIDDYIDFIIDVHHIKPFSDTSYLEVSLIRGTHRKATLYVGSTGMTVSSSTSYDFFKQQRIRNIEEAKYEAMEFINYLKDKLINDQNIINYGFKRYKKGMVETKRRKEKENIIEIQEEVKIGNMILEEGDKIEVVRESSNEIITIFENSKYAIEFWLDDDYFMAIDYVQADIKLAESLSEAIALLGCRQDIVRSLGK